MVVRLCRCMGFNLADFGWLILTVTSNADAWENLLISVICAVLGLKFPRTHVLKKSKSTANPSFDGCRTIVLLGTD